MLLREARVGLGNPAMGGLVEAADPVHSLVTLGEQAAGLEVLVGLPVPLLFHSLRAQGLYSSPGFCACTGAVVTARF